jgi:quinol monooxygenase YgiN
MAAIVAVADVYGLVGRRAELLDLMRETQGSARENPGCLTYTFAETLDDPGHFVLVQEWRDQAALDEHYRSPGFASYQERVGEFLARPTQLRVHQVAETLLPADSAPMDPRRAD